MDSIKKTTGILEDVKIIGMNSRVISWTYPGSRFHRRRCLLRKYRSDEMTHDIRYSR